MSVEEREPVPVNKNKRFRKDKRKYLRTDQSVGLG